LFDDSLAFYGIKTEAAVTTRESTGVRLRLCHLPGIEV